MLKFFTHMAVSMLTLLFCVLYLYVGKGMLTDLDRFDIQYDAKRENLIFKLCNPTYALITFEDNIFFWHPAPNTEANGLTLEYKMTNGEQRKFLDPHVGGQGFGDNRAILTQFNQILPFSCMTKKYPMIWPGQGNVKSFRVLMRFYGYLDNGPYSVVESDWFVVNRQSQPTHQ